MSDYVRWNEVNLYPRGLLQDAPAPRELIVARVEVAETRAKAAKYKKPAIAQLV